MSDSFAHRYWRTVKKCCCPCIYKDEDEIPLIGKVWNNYFSPAPEPGWDQLPKCVKDTVNRTSTELQRYATARKSGVTNEDFARTSTVPNDMAEKLGNNVTAIADAAKEKLGGLLFGEAKQED